MATNNKSVVIEISEDAYKQNTVYRPWIEVKAATSPTKHTAPPGQLQSLSEILRLRQR